MFHYMEDAMHSPRLASAALRCGVSFLPYAEKHNKIWNLAGGHEGNGIRRYRSDMRRNNNNDLHDGHVTTERKQRVAKRFIHRFEIFMRVVMEL